MDFIVMPGGYGTLDEFFEAITLIQTGKFRRFPIVLMGREFHSHLSEHLESLARVGAIDPADLDLFLLTDSVDEAVAHIRSYALEGFGLKPRKHYRPFRLLGERRPPERSVPA